MSTTTTGSDSLPLFRIRKPAARHAGVQAYWVESTAPLNVDEADEPAEPFTDTVPIGSDDAIAEMAEALNKSESPQVVVSVHGFNNPFPVVRDRFTAAYEFVAQDSAIRQCPGLVCIGYRWPSEPMGAPRASVFAAAPRGLLWAFGAAAGLVSVGLGLQAWQRGSGRGRRIADIILTVCGLLAGAVPFTAFLERILVYFRDGYRAINYGVPDLVEAIRHLDRAANQQTPDRIRPDTQRIRLSFIGHSMGAFVVTNLLRILSNVFDPEMMTETLAGSASPKATPRAATGNDDTMHAIGNVFTLERLVLVSPDIPAETLLQGRANFLQSSLRRFREAYLFSNEGDEALRLISTIANYFSFPTLSRNFGYRLGNTSIVRPAKPRYGIVNLDRLRHDPAGEADLFLVDLRAGHLTLAGLSDCVASASTKCPSGNTGVSPLPALFTYFDCTDYIDGGRMVRGAMRGGQGIMTFAKRKQLLSDWDHFTLLLSYLFRQTPDVHSGYFSHPFSQCLIYRLACLGFSDTMASGPVEGQDAAGIDAWSAACAAHQVQVLLSPRLYSDAT